MIKALLMLAGGAALWKLSKPARRAQSADRKPRSENRWEGEGGALRDIGAQTGPSPSVVTAG